MRKPQTSVPLAPIMKKLLPICFVTGAAMEAFMVKTGFYDIVTVSEDEKRAERAAELREMEANPPQLTLNWPTREG
ncbi:hypothetical protein Poli38472_005084 [Pythium oligandrum]|uniref:Uncharacterized protein n=1 Tax=Pythium oligandrum TaxID=41045 RepID=A0A8K1CFF3_PYTOL|nr:hypothetical protein Poli38472_005084 [Pythium oligandrum]|eukprot:TMW62466.1 hypothetical protein Poli38472_005084 [Pythium oligandrum]